MFLRNNNAMVIVMWQLISLLDYAVAIVFMQFKLFFVYYTTKLMGYSCYEKTHFLLLV